MAIENEAYPSDDTLLRDESQLSAVCTVVLADGFQPVVVLVCTIYQSGNNDMSLAIAQGVAGQVFTAADEHLAQRILEGYYVTLVDGLPTDASVVEKASSLTRAQPIAPTVYHDAVALQELRLQAFPVNGIYGKDQRSECQYGNECNRDGQEKLQQTLQDSTFCIQII